MLCLVLYGSLRNHLYQARNKSSFLAFFSVLYVAVSECNLIKDWKTGIILQLM